MASRPPGSDGGIESINMYTDIKSCRFGSQQVNILDAFALQGSSNKGYTHTLSLINKLQKQTNSTAIRISGKDGYPVVFKEGRSATAILHSSFIYIKEVSTFYNYLISKR